MKPDVVFCHGPFLLGDYRVAETLLAESASILKLCEDPPEAPPIAEPPHPAKDEDPTVVRSPPKSPMLKASEKASEFGQKLSSYWHHPTPPAPSVEGNLTPADVATNAGASTKPASTNPSPALSTSALPTMTSAPRRILVVVLGISPHRKLWTTSARPGESVLNYHLLNGCPALVLPAASANGSTPLVAWDTLTLEHLHKIGKEKGGVDGEAFKGVVACLFEYLSLCTDWDRVVIPEGAENTQSGAVDDGEFKKKIVRDGLELVLAGAVRSHDSKAVQADVDSDRAGIAMFRMP